MKRSLYSVVEKAEAVKRSLYSVVLNRLDKLLRLMKAADTVRRRLRALQT